MTLNKNNTGKIQLACVRSTNERGGVGTGYALPAFNLNAIREIEDIQRNLGVNADLIAEKTALLDRMSWSTSKISKSPTTCFVRMASQFECRPTSPALELA